MTPRNVFILQGNLNAFKYYRSTLDQCRINPNVNIVQDYPIGMLIITESYNLFIHHCSIMLKILHFDLFRVAFIIVHLT